MKFKDIENGTLLLLASVIILGIGFIALGFLALQESDEHDAITKSKTYTVMQGDKKYEHLKLKYNTYANDHFLNNEGKGVTFNGSYVIIEE